MPNVMVIGEIRDGSVKKISRECGKVAQDLASGGTVTGVLVGPGAEAGAGEMAGCSKVFAVEDDGVARYSSEGYAAAIAGVVKNENPDVVVLGWTAMGKDLGPRLAQKLDAGLFSDCMGVELAGGGVQARRPVLSGKVHALVNAPDSKPQVVALRPNCFPAIEGAAEAVEKVASGVSAADLKAVVKEVVKAASARADLTEADIIVSGGRAMKSADNFKILDELADVLGASVGASRAAVDSGYAPHANQVGQTGKIVNPGLYIACGISGAIQHLAGMRTSKVIVAVNKDPEAPIFTKADYGIVGDLFKVVPLLTEEFKKLLAE